MSSLKIGADSSASYGCLPAIELVGLIGFGKANFAADVELPARSPGVIFTLPNGDEMLLRPVDDVVLYGGPVPKTMELFYANGDVHTVPVDDCPRAEMESGTSVG